MACRKDPQLSRWTSGVSVDGKKVRRLPYWTIHSVTVYSSKEETERGKGGKGWAASHELANDWRATQEQRYLYGYTIEQNRTKEKNRERTIDEQLTDWYPSQVYQSKEEKIDGQRLLLVYFSFAEMTQNCQKQLLPHICNFFLILLKIRMMCWQCL